MKWVALFSHTGNEIANISTRLNVWPNIIITNQSPGKHINSDVLSKEITYVNNKPGESMYSQLTSDADIVTLHGWMRIVPKVACKSIKMFNLHPGLITEYPELKGKDPQSRVLNQTKTYTKVGCVIHKVTSELDGGEVVMERSLGNHFYSEEQLTKSLHDMASDMWVDFLIDKL